MTDKMWTGLTAKSGSRAASCAVLACALGAMLVVAAPARAEDDGKSLENRIIGGILEGVGLQKDRDPINYSERAPLVIPPSRALPPPEKSDAAITRNSAWPKDPDVARRKAEAAHAHRMTTDEREHEMDRLRPEELTPGAAPSRQARADDGYRPGPNSISTPMTPSQLGYVGNLFTHPFGKKDESVGKFTKEPPRAALTDPPPGYQTPSPGQPYGVGKAAATTRAPTNYLEEHGVLTSD